VARFDGKGEFGKGMQSPLRMGGLTGGNAGRSWTQIGGQILGNACSVAKFQGQETGRRPPFDRRPLSGEVPGRGAEVRAVRPALPRIGGQLLDPAWGAPSGARKAV